MGRKLSLKDKIVKMYKKNDTAGLIYMTFVKGKDDKEKREAIDIFIELAKIDNKDKLLRSKALAILGFFKSMSCGERVEKFYEDGSIFCRYRNIAEVIEDNSKEAISILEAHDKIDLNEDFVAYKLISQVIYCLSSYQINPKIASKLFNLLEKKLSLKKKQKLGKMDEIYLYINGQILRLRPKFKI